MRPRMSELGQTETFCDHARDVRSWGKTGRNQLGTGHPNHSLDNPSYHATDLTPESTKPIV